MLSSQWRIFTDTKTPENAERLLSKLVGGLNVVPLDVCSAPYHKGGHTVTFRLLHDCVDWQLAVFKILAIAQRFAYGWSITGDIEVEFDLFSTKCSVPGITMLHCFVARPGTVNAR